jgi:4-aminobutyrate aminotransferase/(S)-3-amino-2-methylpropionate transaminase
MPNGEKQGQLLNLLRQGGVEAAGCGDESIRMRPMLIFAPKHAAQFLDILSNSLAKM